MVMRIGGMASGMDIDMLVKDLMASHRKPADKLFHKKQTLEWQREAYKELNAKLLDFRNNVLFNYRMEGTFNAKKTQATGNTAAVSAKAIGDAQVMSFNVNVDNLAKAASKWSTANIRAVGAAGAEFDSNRPLATQGDNLAGELTQSTYTVKINGKSVSIDTSTDSLQSIIKKINKETDVTAFYDSVSGKVSFVSKQTGLTNQGGMAGEYIKFEDDGDFLQNVLNINVTTDDATDSKAAERASVNVNGLQMTPDSNTIIINGVELTLLQESQGMSTDIKVDTDVDKIIDTVKSFINAYNDFLAYAQDRIDEKRYRDFLPLTDEQKKDMKENEIKLWEERAKSGMLRNDTILSQMVFSVRMSMINLVETGNTDYRTISSIGIETGKYYENGKLYLKDEAKLRETIEKDPEAVRNIFAMNGGTAETSGIAQRMYDSLMGTIEKVSEKAGTPRFSVTELLNEDSLMGEQLRKLNREIDRSNQRLSALEASYYRKFTAMEKAIDKFNSQAAYLANAFGQGQG